MKPTRSWLPSLLRNELQATTFSLRIVVMRLDVGERVEALVVLRAVEVHAERLAVARERVAVGAGVHAGEQHAARGLATRCAAARRSAGPCSVASGLMTPFFARRRHERHVAVEDRRADRVLRGADAHLARARRRVRPARGSTPRERDRRRGRRPSGALIAAHVAGVRLPGARRGLLRRQLRQLVRLADRARVDLAERIGSPADVALGAGGEPSAKRDLDLPAASPARRVAPQERRRRHVRREDRARRAGSRRVSPAPSATARQRPAAGPATSRSWRPAPRQRQHACQRRPPNSLARESLRRPPPCPAPQPGGAASPVPPFAAASRHAPAVRSRRTPTDVRTAARHVQPPATRAAAFRLRLQRRLSAGAARRGRLGRRRARRDVEPRHERVDLVGAQRAAARRTQRRAAERRRPALDHLAPVRDGQLRERLLEVRRRRVEVVGVLPVAAALRPVARRAALHEQPVPLRLAASRPSSRKASCIASLPGRAPRGRGRAATARATRASGAAAIRAAHRAAPSPSAPAG